MKKFIVLFLVGLLVAACVASLAPLLSLGNAVAQPNIVVVTNTEGVFSTPTSDYVPSGETNVTFSQIASAEELTRNGVAFSDLTLEALKSYQLKPGETFAYIKLQVSASGEQVVNYGLFKTVDLASYLASGDSALSLFMVSGDEAIAKQNVRDWCVSAPRMCITSD